MKLDAATDTAFIICKCEASKKSNILRVYSDTRGDISRTKLNATLALHKKRLPNEHERTYKLMHSSLEWSLAHRRRSRRRVWPIIKPNVAGNDRQNIQIQQCSRSSRSLARRTPVNNVRRIHIPRSLAASRIVGASNSISPHARGHKVRSRRNCRVVT